MGVAMILVGDCREMLATLEAGSAHTCITSPPYWGLRDYGHAGQLGLEETPDAYVANMVEVFRAVSRVLRPDGTLWLNLGDSYAGSNASQGGDGSTSGLMRDGRREATRLATTARDQSRLTAQRTQPKRGSGLKPKDLVGIPWRVAFALQADGWYLRSDIIWAKPNPMPESVTDRPTKAHEYLFLFAHPGSKGRYYYDADAVREPHTMKPQRRPAGRPVDQTPRSGHPKQAWSTAKRDIVGVDGHPDGRNKRTVWTIPTQPFPGAHFAVMPPALVIPCVKAGCPEGGTVLDPFAGAGTVGVVATGHGRQFIGCEINPEYAAMAEARIANPAANLRKPDANPAQVSLFGGGDT